MVVVEELGAHHLVVVGLGHGVVGVGHGKEALGRRVVVVDELPGLLGQHAQQLTFGVFESGADTAVAVPHEALPAHHDDCSMVAHSPWRCSRATSSSARSRGPEVTTARPGGARRA